MNVSVVVPTHNRAHLIGETLRSILDQTYPPHEVVVVDDGSTDNTADVVTGFGAPVRYFAIAKSGDQAARNTGFDRSVGDWVAYCDSDDLWRPHHLAQHLRLRQLAPEIEYVFSDFLIVRDGIWHEPSKFAQAPPGYWEPGRRAVAADLWAYEEPLIARLIQYQPIFPSTIGMTRRYFEKVGRWNETLAGKVSSDFELHLRCAAAPPFGVIATPTVGIRKHGANLSGNVLSMVLGDIEMLLFSLERHPSSSRYRKEILQSVDLRRRQALSLAFAEKRFDLVDTLFSQLPPASRSTKEYLKYLTSNLPYPVRKWSVDLLLTLGSSLAQARDGAGHR